MDRRVAIAAAVSLLLVAAAPAASSPGAPIDVVVLLDADHPGVRGAGADVAADHGVEARHVYSHAVDGFAGSVPAARRRGLERDPRVAVVEADVAVAAAAQTVPTGVQRVRADENPAIPTDGDGGAVDATVAVLDTGIDPDHPDLDVVAATTCLTEVRTGPPSQRGVVCEPGGVDRHGHGTHVAGTVAARNDGTGVVGVAPGARLWSVQVLDDDGAGTASTLIAGVDHVTAHADTIDVANLSLAGEGSLETLDAAISASVAAGVTYVLAAGNAATDVDGVFPAGHPDALTVSALADYDGLPGGLAQPTCGDAGPDDTFATFSNHGAGIDLIAPGVCISSTVPGGGTAVASGTSMAAPHVAGAAALLASQGLGVAEVAATLLTTGTQDWDVSTDPDDHHEPLLDVGDAGVFAPRLVVDDAPGDGSDDGDDGADDGSDGGGGDDGSDGGGGDDGSDGDGSDPDEGDDPDDGDGADGVSLEGAAVSLRGGQWEARVTVRGAPSDAGATVTLTSLSERGVEATHECALDDEGTCAVTRTLHNRDSSVTVTATHLGGVALDPAPAMTVSR